MPPDKTVIVIHDSDSEPESASISKRPRTSSGVTKKQKGKGRSGNENHDSNVMDVDADEVVHPGKDTMKPVKSNAHLKGRRRFTADLADMKEECKSGFHMQRLMMGVQKFRDGDDEGSMECEIVDQHGQHVVAVNLLVSDTSEYPDHHTYFSFSPDDDVPPRITEAIEGISSGQSLPIRDALIKLLNMLSRASAPQTIELQETDEDEDEDVDAEDYDAYDSYENFGELTGSSNGVKQVARLKRDFIETVAAGYRPGYIGFGGEDFGITVSLPITTLALSIPPRAMMAWDRRLLSCAQHLTLFISGLRGTYPLIGTDGGYTSNATRHGVALRFQVGLGGRYKPGKEAATDAARTFGWIGTDAEEELWKEKEKRTEETYCYTNKKEEPEEIEDTGRFDRFSLSSSLESLMDQSLLRLIQIRKKFSLGWAGAEALLSEVEKSQKRPEDIFDEMNQMLLDTDMGEAKLAMTYTLPPDPLLGHDSSEEINLPLTAFCYLVRRLTLCTRYCPVCHNPVNRDFEALKPYVCDSKLCAYQYYSLNRGPSLEYEILTNPEAVDLLVSLAYSAASENVLDEPLPTGLGLRVPDLNKTSVQEERDSKGKAAQVDADLCYFDELDISQMRKSIMQLIDSLPSIDDMKRHLERRVGIGKSKPRLKDMDPAILPSAWAILRWCVASCTAYLEEIVTKEEQVQNIDPQWKQYRFSVGAPDAEAKFTTAVAEAQQSDKNAKAYPSLFAFHGSPLRNWHSIIRHGLWYKTVVHGRSYGNGVYLAKDGSVSMGHYAQPGGGQMWKNSKICVRNCVALAEIVNLPSRFVSSNPYFVVGETHWIMCRYLLVRGNTIDTTDDDDEEADSAPKIPFVKLDPAHPITLTMNNARGHKKIQIPQPSYQLEKLLAAREAEFLDEDPDAEDVAIFEAKDTPSSSSQANREAMEIDDGEGSELVVATPKRRADDWVHDERWVMESIAHVMPPPFESSPTATMAVQRELRAMLKEQKGAASLAELGWYVPPDQVGDNLFQWIVELHSFDEALPIAKDMKAKRVNSIVFEIRFPALFPLAPPFFRIIMPRFLPFIEGGGGHVTGGGSICMDLLTSDGWLPSYSVSAILLQIKLAISNLDPRPAKLARNWQKAYQVHEALEGYKRAATAHGWRIPQGLEKLVR